MSNRSFNTTNRRFSRRAFMRAGFFTGASLATVGTLVSLNRLAKAQNTQTADLIAFNGRITTLNPQQPEASALAIKDGEFIAVGTDDELLQLRGTATEVIDLNGRRVIPGLNDSHVHVTRGGRFYNLELRWDGVPTLAMALEMLREQADRTPEGQWVRVIGGWNPYQFAEKRMPTVEELNEAAPNSPVFVLYLYSRGFLNQAGLQALSIDETTQAPQGGRYELGDDGKPTGVLLAEPNPTILYQTIGALPEMSAQDQINSTKQFYRDLNRFGLTSAIDAGGGGHEFPSNYQATEAIAEAGELPLRISYYLFPQTPGEELQDFQRWIGNNSVDENAALSLQNGYVLEGGGEFLVWSAGDFENFMATQPMLSDRDNWRNELKAVTREIVSNGWPLRIHATYGESISNILDVFEEVDRELSFSNIRWAIDHAETIKPAEIERIKNLGGGIAIQDRIAYAGEYFIDRYGAEAAKTAPPIRSILDAGIPLGAGTDATRVASYNPWVSLYWLVSGRTAGQTQLYDASNRLSRSEALQLWTVGSAWFSGEENIKGKIAPQQLGDFAVLSDDYFAVPEAEIKNIESVLTIVGGKVVYGDRDYESLNPALPAVSPNWSPVAYYGGYYNAES